jgi:hypothetical protein
MRVGMKKQTLRSNQETDEGKRCAALANSLKKKAPYKGLGADSVEKHEPASDIDTAVVDSLKVLDPNGRLEKRTLGDLFDQRVGGYRARADSRRTRDWRHRIGAGHHRNWRALTAAFRSPRRPVLA